MIKNFKIKRAKKHDAKKLRELFVEIDPEIKTEEVQELIKNKEIVVLKKKSKIKAAFSYAIFGIIGIFSFMYIRKIAVDQKSRGKGIGSFLLKKIKKFSTSNKVDFSFLYSLNNAVSFYKKNKLEKFGNIFWWKN